MLNEATRTRERPKLIWMKAIKKDMVVLHLAEEATLIKLN